MVKESSKRKQAAGSNIPKVSRDLPTTKKGNIDPITKGILNSFRTERINFSFKLFDRACEKFNCGGVDQSWFIGLIDRLKNVSDMTLEDFMHSRNQDRMYIHTNDFDEVEKYASFSGQLLEQLMENPFYQIGVSKATGRVHGFLVNNTFFVLWLDPHHQLHVMDRHGGEKKHGPSFSELEIVEFERNSYYDAYMEQKELADLAIEENEELLKKVKYMEEGGK